MNRVFVKLLGKALMVGNEIYLGCSTLAVPFPTMELWVIFVCKLFWVVTLLLVLDSLQKYEKTSNSFFLFNPKCHTDEFICQRWKRGHSFQRIDGKQIYGIQNPVPECLI